ncbi:tail tape measure protein [Stenotrophomonas phage BUCT603]|nr:tail tape measure protein [Stenotrophomonas phage BUCT603]
MATEQTIGTAKIVVDVDTSRVEAGSNRAKQSVQSMGDSMVKVSNDSTAALNRSEQALLKQIRTYGLDAEGKLRYAIATKATQKNVEALTAELDKQLEALRQNATQSEAASRVEEGSARRKLTITRANQQVEESERSLAERRRLGNQVLNDSTKGMADWAKEQQLANARGAELMAQQQKQTAPAQAAARATQEQADALNKLVHSIDPAVKQLDLLDQKERQLAMYRKQGLISTGDYDNLSAKLREQRALIGGVDAAMARGGMSARQYNAALRGLPAQFTDIAVSLQAGQQPLTVLLQQGGQLKDMFGGIGPAIQAMGGYMMGLVNPVTITAAALGTMGIAAYQGSLEMGKLERSLITSGNAAGVSAAGMAEMASQLDGLAGVTTGKAVDALAAVAATGAFTGEQMQMVTAASLEWSVATGTAVDDTVASFAKIADDPVQALLTLNKQMGFLTEESLKVVQQLVEQGRHTEAVTEAIKLMADTLHTRSGQMVENTGYLEKAWRGVKNAVAETWDAIKAIGRDETITDRINQLKGNLKNLEAQTTLYAGLSEKKRKELADQWRAEIAAMEKAAAGAKAINVENGQTPEQRRALEANVAFQKTVSSEMDKQLTLEEKIAKMRNDALKAGVTNYDLIDQREAQMRDAEARRLAKRVQPTGDGGLGAAKLQAIKAEGEAEKAAIANTTQELRAQFGAREVSAKDYYDRMRQLAEQSTEVEAKTIQRQIESLREQTGKRKESGAIAQQIAALESQLGKVREAGASKVRVLTTEEETAARKRAEGLQAYRDAMQAQTDTLAKQMDAMVARERMSSRDFEQQSAINAVLAEQAKQLKAIADEEQRRNLDKGEADERRDALRQQTRDQIQIIRDGYAEADAARLDFMGGVDKGFAEFTQSASDISGQMANALSNAFNGAADAIVQFTQTGKLSFSDLARSIMADLTRIAVKIAMSQALTSMFGNMGGGAGGAAAGAMSSFGNNLASQGGSFWTGGYTGAGGKYEPAGVVHKGEVVFSQDDVARAGGVAAVERMRMSGGASPITTGGFGGGGGAASPANVVVNLIGLKEPPKEQRQSMVDGQMQIDMIWEEFDGRMAEGISNGTSRTAMAMGKK